MSSLQGIGKPPHYAPPDYDPDQDLVKPATIKDGGYEAYRGPTRPVNPTMHQHHPIYSYIGS